MDIGKSKSHIIFFLQILTPLKLNILAARVVVSQRQDFSLHFTGINRQGIFIIHRNIITKIFPQARAGRIGQVEGWRRSSTRQRGGTNLKEEKLLEEEWQHELSSMTIREQREMEKFLRESGER